MEEEPVEQIIPHPGWEDRWLGEQTHPTAEGENSNRDFIRRQCTG